MIEALRYKLRMFGGVPIEGPTDIFCERGQSMTRLESKLTKKHHSFAYHRSREDVAPGTVRVSKEHTPTNSAVTFINTMAAPKREELLGSFNRKGKLSTWVLCHGPPTFNVDAFIYARLVRFPTSSRPIFSVFNFTFYP